MKILNYTSERNWWVGGIFETLQTEEKISHTHLSTNINPYPLYTLSIIHYQFYYQLKIKIFK